LDNQTNFGFFGFFNLRWICSIYLDFVLL